MCCFVVCVAAADDIVSFCFYVRNFAYPRDMRDFDEDDDDEGGRDEHMTMGVCEDLVMLGLLTLLLLLCPVCSGRCC